ncbi:MAG: DUF1697 domain-containing protein [Rhodobacterales bacterium]|nr:DUF1697 domain-containing protein [Rhodobacterales bacterium]
MQDWVALLRGVNVGGGNKVPMADLRQLAEGLGWTGVRTYVASGNLVFRAEGQAGPMADALRGAMRDGIGVDVPVVVLPGDAVRDALAACPFDPDAGKQVHVMFLFGPITVDEALRDSLRASSETLVVDGTRAWLHTPEGFGTSKLATKIDRVIRGAPMTVRNLNTLRALVEMLDGPERG